MQPYELILFYSVNAEELILGVSPTDKAFGLLANYDLMVKPFCLTQPHFRPFMEVETLPMSSVSTIVIVYDMLILHNNDVDPNHNKNDWDCNETNNKNMVITKTGRRKYLKQLGMSLVMEQFKRRAIDKHISRDVRLKAAKFSGQSLVEQAEPPEGTYRRCAFCPKSQNKISTTFAKKSFVWTFQAYVPRLRSKLTF
ncbi:hypothetical protein JTB14_008310 [Gonioctena quinquepunctata]|nr:hypothetical protein JTB14_008310 [Gonioctena quinquepunctata]